MSTIELTLLSFWLCFFAIMIVRLEKRVKKLEKKTFPDYSAGGTCRIKRSKDGSVPRTHNGALAMDLHQVQKDDSNLHPTQP